MNIVEIEKLTQLDNRYLYRMLVVNTESAIDYYTSLDGNAYKFRNWYYIPIGESRCTNKSLPVS